MDELERAIVEAAVAFHKHWKGYIPNPGSVLDLLQAVNNYIAKQGIKKINENNYCNHDVMLKLNEVILAVNKLQK